MRLLITATTRALSSQVAPETMPDTRPWWHGGHGGEEPSEEVIHAEPASGRGRRVKRISIPEMPYRSVSWRYRLYPLARPGEPVRYRRPTVQVQRPHHPPTNGPAVHISRWFATSAKRV